MIPCPCCGHIFEPEVTRALRIALGRGDEISLSKTEWGILKLLIEARGEIVSSKALLTATKSFYEKGVKVHIGRIRHKLLPYGIEISNTHGVGYHLLWNRDDNEMIEALEGKINA